MKWSLALVSILALGVQGCSPGGGSAGSAAFAVREGVYVLGSSYSRDALPEAFDNYPEWEIYCGKPLDYIFTHPYGYCHAGSRPWPDALEPPAEAFAYISFQPVAGAGSTRAQDVSHISYWLAEQPLGTVAVIHTTWPFPANWETELHAQTPDHDFTNYSLDYYYVLMEDLELANPGRVFVLTRANEMMDHVRHDPTAPISFDELFRDTAGHMSPEIGRYLQHNAFRQALDQDVGIDSTINGVPPDIRTYLDEVIDRYPAR